MSYSEAGQQAKQWNPDRITAYQVESIEKAKAAQAAQSGKWPTEAALIGGGMAGAIGKGKSPIEVQLDEQSERLAALSNAMNEVIDKLLPILNHDPRSQPQPVNPATASNPIICELEGFLMARNREISEATDRLREIRRLICL